MATGFVVTLAISVGLALAGIPSTCERPGQVVLSFDQGPGATTGKVLDVLSRRNVPAMFHFSADLFQNATWRGYVQRAAYEGHTIGLFVPDIGSPVAKAVEDFTDKDWDEYELVLSQRLARDINWIASITGRPPRHVRFGRKTIPSNSRKMAEVMGLHVTRPRIEIRDESNKMDVIWNSINKAFNGTDPATNSFIIRLRDIMPNMVASLDKLIDYVEEKGFRIVPMEACQPVPDRLNHFKALGGDLKQYGKMSSNDASSGMKISFMTLGLMTILAIILLID